MALPPGTSGWVGSGFDCTCECNFVAGFAYNGNEPAYWGNDPPSICSLVFAVGNVTDGCTPVDIETADITVELAVNGTPITDPMIVDAVNNVLYWEAWKPTAGDVYTATVTLDCGYGTITVREYEFTIPAPANTNCDCCAEKEPDYVVLSGFSGVCCSFANGTYALTQAGTCFWQAAYATGAPATGDRCNAALACKTVNISGTTYYLHPGTVSIRVGIGVDPITLGILGTDEVRVAVQVAFYAYRDTFGCSQSPSSFGSDWIFLSECSNYFTLESSFVGECATTPTMQLFFK